MQLTIRKGPQVIVELSRSGDTLISDVLADVCAILGIQSQLLCLSFELAKLASTEKEDDEDEERQEFEPLDATSADKLMEVAAKLKAVSETCVDRTEMESRLAECIGGVKEALSCTAFISGIPEDSPISAYLAPRDDVCMASDHELWWASKRISQHPEKHALSDFVGRNEKTNMIVKFQKIGSGPPVKDPPLNEQGQRELLAYYYKKQEQEKKLNQALDNEMDFSSSRWTDTKALKNYFNGVGNVSWKPR
eukprot:Partr_v1_DN27735_c1_g1_i11_m67061 putative Chromosome 21 open reading frame 59